MADDRTEHQSEGGQLKARSLSSLRSAPPTTVPGYEIQRFLGSGAFGEVWVAVDQNTGRRVAIKFYTGRCQLDMALLSREVEKLVFLSSDRYVVQLLDVGWDATPPYYVMDYIEQGSLEDYLQESSPLDVRHATELFHEIAVGLSHLHNRGVLHCDLKPANVLLDEDHKPRLADFGQARLASERDPALGTLFFMAPEQADLEAAPDARWDVYALGAIMYTMLLGEPPYRSEASISEVRSGESVSDRLARYRRYILEAERPSDHRRVKGMDRVLADIIDRCLSINPKNRFASVQEVLYALQQRREAETRRPMLLLGLVAPVVLLVVIAIFGWGIYRNSIGHADDSLKAKAQESNGWAAQFAARSAAERIDMFLGSVSSLSTNETLIQELRKIDREIEGDTAWRESLSDPHHNSSLDAGISQDRQRFNDWPVRQPLQQWIQSLLSRDDTPNVASWFVCDREGLQVAAAFPQSDVQPTIGKCYAYRTYFTGASDDLVRIEQGATIYEIEPEPSARQHITQPHLSAVFASQATGMWKIAFSAPIMIDGEFAGILAATVNMGEFMEFSDQVSQFVVLVDERPGRNQGAILEHPLFDAYREENRSLPPEFRQIRIDTDELKSGFAELRDPLGQTDGGKDYDRLWLAASRPVQRRADPNDLRDDPQRVETGLIVLALEDAEAILAPVHELSESFVRLGLIALGLGVSIMLGMWLFSIRSLRLSRRNLLPLRQTALDRSLTPHASTSSPSLDATVDHPSNA